MISKMQLLLCPLCHCCQFNWQQWHKGHNSSCMHIISMANFPMSLVSLQLVVGAIFNWDLLHHCSNSRILLWVFAVLSLNKWHSQERVWQGPGPPIICYALPLRLKNQDILINQSNILLKQSIGPDCAPTNYNCLPWVWLLHWFQLSRLY